MTNYKMKFVKSAAALALGASVITSAVVSGDLSASAKTTYKVSNGKLVNAKTKKAIKGYKVYKSVLYKDGKKFTGIYKAKYYKTGKLFTGLVSKTYYKKGVKATATYKGVYYKAGKAFTGTKSGYYYKNGVKYTGKTTSGIYYKNGKKFNGTTTAGYYYIDGKRAEGTVDVKGVDVLYKNGKVVADKTAPVITIDGQKTDDKIELNNGADFTTPKASVKDNVDTKVKVVTEIKDQDGKVVDAVNTKVAGTYTITYAAKDASGNASAATITVVVADLAVESVTPINAKQISVKFEGKEVVAVDLETELVDGENTVTFTYEGKEYTSKVNYEAPDTEAPVISVDGEPIVNVENGEEIVLPKVTATDNKDESVEVKSVITDKDGKEVELKNIDTKVAGTYTVTYSAEDAAGNAAENVVVTVKVNEIKAAKAVTNPADITIVEGETPQLPATVAVTFEDNTTGEAKVAWDESKVEGYTAAKSPYTITGTVEGTETTATIKVTVETKAAFDAAVKAVKTTADANDAENFEAALKLAVLNLENIKDDNIAAYQTAIAEVLGEVSLDQIQEIINTTNKDLEEKATAAETAKVDAILNATKTAELTKALTEADIKYVGGKDATLTQSATELAKYQTAIKNAEPKTIKDVQDAVNAYNKSVVEAAVAKAEASKLQADKDSADSLLKDVVEYYPENAFDVKGTEEGAKTFAERLTAVQEAINAANLAAALDKFKPVITASEADKGEGATKSKELTVNVAYSNLPTDATELANVKDLVKDFTVDAEIEVPAAFAGTDFAVTVGDVVEPITYTVPAATEGKSTITIKLSDILTKGGLQNLPANLADQKGSFDVKVQMPYASATLAEGTYEITLKSVATKGTGETAVVEVLNSKNTNVTVIGNPSVPAAIDDVLTAEEVGNTEAGLIKALETLESVDPTFTFNSENAEAYLEAFNKYTEAEDKAATVATLLETVKSVDDSIALANAISNVETAAKAEGTKASDFLALLNKAEFGYKEDAKTSELKTITKNQGLYLAEFKEIVAANKAVPAVPTFTTAKEIQAVVEKVNATLLGKVNAATTVADAKTAIEAVAASDESFKLYYDVLTDKEKLAVAKAVVANETGYDAVAGLQAVVETAAQ